MKSLLKVLFTVLFFNLGFSQSFTAEKINNSYQIKEVWGCKEKQNDGWNNLYQIKSFEDYFAFYNDTNYKVVKVTHNNKRVNIDPNEYNLFNDGEYLFTLSRDKGKFTIKIIFEKL